MFNLIPQFNRAKTTTSFINRLADRASGVPQALETTAWDALTHFQDHAPKPKGPVNSLLRTATINAVNTLLTKDLQAPKGSSNATPLPEPIRAYGKMFNNRFQAQLDNDIPNVVVKAAFSKGFPRTFPQNFQRYTANIVENQFKALSQDFRPGGALYQAVQSWPPSNVLHGFGRRPPKSPALKVRLPTIY